LGLIIRGFLRRRRGILCLPGLRERSRSEHAKSQRNPPEVTHRRLEEFRGPEFTVGDVVAEVTTPSSDEEGFEFKRLVHAENGFDLRSFMVEEIVQIRRSLCFAFFGDGRNRAGGLKVGTDGVFELRGEEMASEQEVTGEAGVKAPKEKVSAPLRDEGAVADNRLEYFGGNGVFGDDLLSDGFKNGDGFGNVMRLEPFQHSLFNHEALTFGALVKEGPGLSKWPSFLVVEGHRQERDPEVFFKLLICDLFEFNFVRRRMTQDEEAQRLRQWDSLGGLCGGQGCGFKPLLRFFKRGFERLIAGLFREIDPLGLLDAL